MHAAAPDYVEPVLGWRVWLVVDQGRRLALASVLYPTIWPTRSAFAAECCATSQSALRHRVPHVRCGCGIHAAVSVEDAAAYFDGRGGASLREVYRVIGRVALLRSYVRRRSALTNEKTQRTPSVDIGGRCPRRLRRHFDPLRSSN